MAGRRLPPIILSETERAELEAFEAAEDRPSDSA